MQNICEKYDDCSRKASPWDVWSGKLLEHQEEQNIWNSSGLENLGLRVDIEILYLGLQAASFPTAFRLMFLFCEILVFKRTNLNKQAVGSNMLCI